MVLQYSKNRSLPSSLLSKQFIPTTTPALDLMILGCTSRCGRLIHKKPEENPPQSTSPSPPSQKNPPHPYFSFRLMYWPNPQTHKCFAPRSDRGQQHQASREGSRQLHQALREADAHDTTSKRYTSLLSSTRITSWNHTLACPACIKTHTHTHTEHNKISNSLGQTHQYF